ncbi:acyl-CoA dehydrogenase family protein [Lutibacter sp.]|uniref:acyl-CoA dehydrogenase family protein n=1 Tax=Lutibacter sp. TaxID=1925666 RepID=UPI0027359C35|nr:acyl-CoA dehydrogenase family protein [Lutibacter sp.]MDP3314239.1 acyl-CoA dehydrogenase family protein [Lutibacter sp.]
MENNIKGGEFLIKETESGSIFIPEDFNEEQLMMKEAIQDFIDREVWPFKDRLEKKDYKFTEEIMTKAGEMGFLGVSVPTEYGGMGMGFVSSMLVCDYISGASGSISTAYGAHTGIGTMPILFYGTETQKQQYIPKLASGEWFGAYCLTEPGAGSDANSGKTKAVLSEDGKYYSITGQKMWISNAGFCSLMIVFARIENDKNITAFILEYDGNQPNGVTLGEEENKLGIRSSSTRQVFFNETKIPVENMLAKRGDGFKIALNSLNVGRIKLSVACLEAGRRTITESIKYANERIQFNTPIAQFGAIKYKIAEMATKIYSSESANYRAARDIQNKINALQTEGLSHQEAELKGIEEFAIECALLKVFGSEAIQYVADEGIQIFGGMGFSEDTPMESAWRDARIARIYEGTNEINRLLSVSMLLKRAMQGEIDLMGPAMEVGNSLLGIPSFETPDYEVLFSEEKDIIAKLKKAFLMVTGKAVQTYGMELASQQQLVMSAAEMMIEIYMAESAILRTEKLISKTSKETCLPQIAMAQLNLFNAVEKVNSKGREAIFSFAEGDEQRVMLMGLKRFTKYTNNPNPIKLRKVISEKITSENKYCF